MGWEYADTHQAETVKILLADDTAGVLTPGHQITMIREVAKLAPPSPTWGYLQPAAYKRTVAELLSTKSSPVISKQPSGAYSYVVWDKAFKS